MPFNEDETEFYRRDVASKGQTMSTEERKKLLERYLPETPQPRAVASKRKAGRRRRLRPHLKEKLHLLIYLTIQLVFGIYIRTRQIISALFQKFIAVRHYHHRTPAYIQKDLKNLSRLPEHLSVILKYDSTSDDGLEVLLDEVAELSAWSTAADIPLLSVYEKTGILKQYMSAVQEIVQQKLVLYFGIAPSSPTVKVYAPNYPSLSPLPSPSVPGQSNGVNGDNQSDLHLLLLSESDGRDTIVDLTRTLAEMAQAQKLRPKDITVELVDAEISASTSIATSRSSQNTNTTKNSNGTVQDQGSSLSAEPDLLVVFAPYIKLDGYPPWQIRLTEIFCVGDSGGDVSGRSRTRVEYQGFLRALWNYAGAEFRFGS